MTLAHLVVFFLLSLAYCSSHLFAQSRNVSRCFDNPLAAVMVFVELGAEGLERGHEGRDRGRGLEHLVGVVWALDAGHCWVEYEKMLMKGERNFELRSPTTPPGGGGGGDLPKYPHGLVVIRHQLLHAQKGCTVTMQAMTILMLSKSTEEVEHSPPVIRRLLPRSKKNARSNMLHAGSP